MTETQMLIVALTGAETDDQALAIAKTLARRVGPEGMVHVATVLGRMVHDADVAADAARYGTGVA